MKRYNIHNDFGTVQVELNHIHKGTSRILKALISKYRDVVSFLLHVADDHYEELKSLDNMQTTPFMEKLVHKTKDNPAPEYPLFDKIFYKLPCDVRRAAIMSATGLMESHVSNIENYAEARAAEIARGHHYKKMKPGFTFTPNASPVLYNKNSFTIDLSRNEIRIKAFFNNTWDWLTVSLPSRDAKCLMNASLHGKVMNPQLVYKYHKFYLVFPVKYKVNSFPDTPLEGQTVLGADLGLNNGAVCSVVDCYGSVHGRHFSPFKEDMDRIDHLINLIRKHARMSGDGQSLSALYTKLQGLKENYVKQLSRWIVNCAKYYGVYGIVLEHLDIKKGRGRLKSRVHHWCTSKIRDYVKGMAFREGIRVFIINPKGTSQYAFDGSGKVSRNSNNYSLCVFATGKKYNCDLSASYNIAARYFLRAFGKSIPATEWSALKAEVPELSMRTKWTLATLWKVAPAALKMMPTSPSKACAA